MAPAISHDPRPLTSRRLVLLYLFGALAALCLCDECVPWQDTNECGPALDTGVIRTRIFAVPIRRATVSIRLAGEQRPIFAVYRCGLFYHFFSGHSLFDRANEGR